MGLIANMYERWSLHDFEVFIGESMVRWIIGKMLKNTRRTGPIELKFRTCHNGLTDKVCAKFGRNRRGFCFL